MKTDFNSAPFGVTILMAFALIVGMTAGVTEEVTSISSTPTASNKAVTTAPETGIASYYGAKYHGKPTASGEIFDMQDLTAAHPKLAFGTRVKVTHLEKNRSVVVRINDRGPFVSGRVIDLSQAAATQLQMVQSGLARVKVEVLK